MNYIRHLTGFFDRVAIEDRMNPSHISLYMALFQFWNLNRFASPISISREEMMRQSKIRSTATYHKAMKDLDQFGLIRYKPSRNPFRRSEVDLINLGQEPDQKVNRYRANKQTDAKHMNERFSTNNRTLTTHLNEPIYGINSINITNNKDCKRRAHEPSTLNFDQFNLQAMEETQSEAGDLSENSTPGAGSPTVRQLQEIPSGESPPTGNRVLAAATPDSLAEVKSFFTSQYSTALEAEKFFNHFESNGWRVGGRSPMKNWQAAARNWILNSNRFNPVDKTRSKLHAAPKDYSEPL